MLTESRVDNPGGAQTVPVCPRDPLTAGVVSIMVEAVPTGLPNGAEDNTTGISEDTGPEDAEAELN